MKILIMGLPGAGKTWLAERLTKQLECAWFNADLIRGAANDWDFSPEGRSRQAHRMKTFADFESDNGRIVICDFVAPTRSTRESFDADIVIWIDTIKEGRFEDTNKIFEEPTYIDWRIQHHMSEEEVTKMADELKELSYNV